MSAIAQKANLPTLVPTHTPCKGCCFAVVEDKTQTGCHLGHTDTFDRLGDLIAAEDETGQFYIVNRTCKFKRPENWAVNHDNPQEAVKKELSLKMALIVVIPPRPPRGGLVRVCKSILKQSPLPSIVHFVTTPGSHTVGLHEKLFDHLGNSVTWRITEAVEEVSEGALVDIVVEKLKGVSHYAVFHPTTIPETFWSNIEWALNGELLKTVLFTPNKKGDGLVALVNLHRLPEVMGNAPIEYEVDGEKIIISSLEEKVRHLGKCDYITKSRSVCPKLPV